MEKKCGICKIVKDLNQFYRNRTKRDGRAGYCKECSKTAYGKWLECTECEKSFYVNHRNISKRKTSLCKDCSIKATIKRNKARKKPNSTILTDKGYEYYRDLSQKHGYILNHRRIMEKYLGRHLEKNEVVHHIDGDKLNNTIENLYLTNSSGHSFAHASLAEISYHLVQKGMISFSKEKGVYELSNPIVSAISRCSSIGRATHL